MARFLALDWDHQQLHIVEANVGGGTVRVLRAAVWQEERNPTPAEAEALGKLLRERLQAAGISPAPVLLCVGRDRLIVKEIRYPAVPAAEEPAVVRFQVAKELTDTAEEVVIDFVPRPERSPSGERMAFALILRKDLLHAYQTLCKAAGLKLHAVTPRTFGVGVCWERLVGGSVHTPAPEPPDAAVGVLVLAERWAEFCVLKGEQVLFARSLTPGAGLPGEVRRNLAVYAGPAPQEPVRALYVAGSEEHAGLRERLQGMLEIPLHVLDPFGGAERPELPPARRGGFTGAVGLLHAQADRAPLPVNFVKPRQPRPPSDPNLRKLVLAGAVAALLLVGFVAYGYLELARRNDQITELVLAKQKVDSRAVALQEDAKRIKAIDDWTRSSVVVLDELYDLAHRIPDTNAVRISQLTLDPLTRTATSKHSARLSLKGVANDTRSVDRLVAEMVEDRFYAPDAKKTESNRRGTEARQFPLVFTAKADIEQRPPTEYHRQLPAPETKGRPSRGGRGFGKGGTMEMEVPERGGQR